MTQPERTNKELNRCSCVFAHARAHKVRPTLGVSLNQLLAQNFCRASPPHRPLTIHIVVRQTRPVGGVLSGGLVYGSSSSCMTNAFLFERYNAYLRVGNVHDRASCFYACTHTRKTQHTHTHTGTQSERPLFLWHHPVSASTRARECTLEPSPARPHKHSRLAGPVNAEPFETSVRTSLPRRKRIDITHKYE